MSNPTFLLDVVFLLAIFPLAWVVNKLGFWIEPSARATPDRFLQVGSIATMLGVLGGFVLLPYCLLAGNFPIPLMISRTDYTHRAIMHLYRDANPDAFWLLVSVLYVGVILVLGNGVMLLVRYGNFQKDLKAGRWANLSKEKWTYRTSNLSADAMVLEPNFSPAGEGYVFHISSLAIKRTAKSEAEALQVLHEVLRKSQQQFAGCLIWLDAGSPTIKALTLKLAAASRVDLQPAPASYPNEFLILDVRD